jgi:hypothetical protein
MNVAHQVRWWLGEVAPDDALNKAAPDSEN